MTTEVVQRMVPLEDARPLKRARKESSVSEEDSDERPVSPSDKPHPRIFIEEKTPVHKVQHVQQRSANQNTEPTKQQTSARQLSDYMKQHDVSEKKPFLCINLRSSTLNEIYFQGPEEKFGLRPVPSWRMCEVAYPESELLLEIRYRESSGEVVHRKKLDSPYGKFYVAQLAREIISEARRCPGCDPVMTSLELSEADEQSTSAVGTIVAKFSS